MQYQPHDYQAYATHFIEDNRISAILLDMGLGKTVITLTALNDLLFDSFEIHKALIIAPLRVARDTWPNEIKKWSHLSELIPSVVVGTEKERIAALKRKADIYIINRENVPWLIEKSGTRFDYDFIVIDELSSFKNHRAKRFQSLLKARPLASRIVGLTGTPAGNGLMDLWAEFRILDYGKRLGRFITHYRNTYFYPDKRNGMVIFSYKPLAGAEEAIFDQISDITISMKAADHLDMPDLISTEHRVYLSKKEFDKYESFRKSLVLELEGKEITAQNAAVLTNKLSQVANGAIYGDGGESEVIHSKKLEALEDIVESANGKPILVAYWFKHDLERIKEKLDEMGVIYDQIDSEESIKKWNRRELQVGLIHPASAGHGLNLQEGGSTIVWFGLTWSLELYKQTNARLWRQGQESDTVVVIHIIADQTVDEMILKVLNGKETVQNALFEAVKADIGGKDHGS
ncbi:MAG: DEAD/DEAH box helicase [Bacilli bacterium]|jgi:SNF2 family DNA or RNA helicase|nr:DEAD/DEAH box helicase [Bacilli bacterium]